MYIYAYYYFTFFYFFYYIAIFDLYKNYYILDKCQTILPELIKENLILNQTTNTPYMNIYEKIFLLLKMYKQRQENYDKNHNQLYISKKYLKWLCKKMYKGKIMLLKSWLLIGNTAYMHTTCKTLTLAGFY